MLHFFCLFYPKTWWTIHKWGNFYNLFFKRLDLGFRIKTVYFLSFCLKFYPLDPDPSVRILLRIQWIRILSTELNKVYLK